MGLFDRRAIKIFTMVLVLDGNSEHVAHARRKLELIKAFDNAQINGAL